jgi:hypothetical protein
MQYLRDNAGVLESSANGTTWEPVQIGNELQNPCVLGTLQIRDNAGVLEVSDDDGATWTPIGGSPVLPVHIIDTSPTAILAAETQGDVYIIVSGLTIITLPADAPDGAQLKICSYSGDTTIDPPADARIYIPGQDGELGQALICDKTMSGGQLLDLVKFTDTNGDLAAAGDKIWFAVSIHGDFTWEEI